MRVLLYLPDFLCLVTIGIEITMILSNPRTEKIIGLFICSVTLLGIILLEIYSLAKGFSRGTVMSLFMWTVFLTLVWEAHGEYQRYRKYLVLKSRRDKIKKAQL